MQHRKLNLFLLFLLIISIIQFIPLISATPEVIDSYPSSNYESAGSLSKVHPSTTAEASAVGQSFTASKDCNLTSIELELYKVGSPVGYVAARLYSLSGTYGTDNTPNTLLEEGSALSLASLATTHELETFTFSGNTALIEGETYGIVIYIKNATTLSGSHYIMCGRDTTSPTHSGNWFNYGSSQWNSNNARDTIFYVNGEPQPEPTPTPSPTPSPTPEPLLQEETEFPNNNYGDIPMDWGGYNQYGSILFTDEYPPDDHQILSYNTDIERTIELGSVAIESIHGGTENTARECDTGGIPITPGYHIIFSCYIKAGTNSNGRIGIDLYGAGGRICGKQSAGELFPPNENDDLVQANWVVDNGQWNYRKIEFYVPSTAIREGTSTAVEPTFMVAWMQGELDGAETIYFADAVITVNGSFDIEETTVGTSSGNLNIFYVIFGLSCFGVILWQVWKK